MKFLIFAGGSGRRFWPIGRESTPKQFLRLFDGKSTFELTIGRALQLAPPKDIFIFTNHKYKSFVDAQRGEVPPENVYFEPVRKDVGPAVGYALVILRKLGYANEPVMIMWADHIIRREDLFVSAIEKAAGIVESGKYRGVLIGETPYFPATNLGWIKLGERISNGTYQFNGFVYRPPLEESVQLFESRTGVWNTAYFVSTPAFMLGLYEKNFPDLYGGLVEIEDAFGTHGFDEVLKKVYPTLEEVHFDHVVFYNLSPDNTAVVKTDMGWLDPGTLYALKKYYEPSDRNYTRGNALLFDSNDSMVINLEGDDKLAVGVGLDGVMLVVTKDAVLAISGKKAKRLSDVVKLLGKDDRYRRFVE